MPTYDFFCEKCNKSFSLTMSISEHGKKQVVCPKCKGKKIKQQVTSFQTKTSKKS
jgi:putative FmdB family regulatory protein